MRLAAIQTKVLSKLGRGCAHTVGIKILIFVLESSQQSFWDTPKNGRHMYQVSLRVICSIDGPCAVKEKLVFRKLPDLAQNTVSICRDSCSARIRQDSLLIPGSICHVFVPVCFKDHLRCSKHLGLGPLCQMLVEPAS